MTEPNPFEKLPARRADLARVGLEKLPEAARVAIAAHDLALRIFRLLQRGHHEKERLGRLADRAVALEAAEQRQQILVCELLCLGVLS